MDLWKDIVRKNKIPVEEGKKLRYNTEQLVCSTIAQEYHVMIQKGLEYSYLTNRIARILLRVPYDDPSTLYYFFCDPNRELEGEIAQNLQEPKTSIARVLCDASGLPLFELHRKVLSRGSWCLTLPGSDTTRIATGTSRASFGVKGAAGNFRMTFENKAAIDGKELEDKMLTLEVERYGNALASFDIGDGRDRKVAEV